MKPYQVEFKKADQIFTLHLLYQDKNLHSREIEQHMRAELERRKEECQTDILVSAWHIPNNEDENLLPLEDGSLHIIYVRSRDIAIRWNEYSGSSQDVKETGEYFCVIETSKTLEGITPAREWLTIMVLFKNPTPSQSIYATLLQIGEEWAEADLDLNLYAYYGNQLNRITWEQIKDTDRRYMFLNYTAATRRFTRDDYLLKQL